MQKKINSLIHPVIIQIILKRLTVFLSEQLSEIGAVDIIFLAKPLECEVIRIMFLNFFLYISENTSGYILAKLGQIVSVLTGETHQMCLTAAHRSCFKAALRNQTQDFFLIDLIILLACKMDQLKKQIVNIKRHGFPTQASLTHFSIEMVHRRPDFHMIVLLHYLQQIIKTLLAQNHTVIGHLHFFLVEIDVLFASKSLKGTKHTGIPV